LREASQPALISRRRLTFEPALPGRAAGRGSALWETHDFRELAGRVLVS